MPMADYREPDGPIRLPSDPSPDGAGRVAERASEQVARRAHAPGETIRAVSRLLSARATVLNNPPLPARVNLPDLSGPVEAAIRRLKKDPDLRIKFDRPPTSLESPPVSFPADGPKGPETSPGEIPAIDAPAALARQSARVAVGGASAGGGDPRDAGVAAPSPRSIVGAAGSSASPGGQSAPDPRFVPPASVHLGAIGAIGSAVGPTGSAGTGPGQGDGPASRRGPVPVGDMGPSVRDPGATSASGLGSIALTPDPGTGTASAPDHGGGIGPVASGVAGDGGGAEGGRAPSGPRVDSARIGVRGPLTAGLRDLSMASPDFPGARRAEAVPGGIGSAPAGAGFGETSGPQGGASIDLSKTNELLQQLVDAVRKQRGGPLPAGGPSVYPDR